jgi:Tfp pilus assembly protein PilF
MNFDGNYALASSFFRTIVKLLPASARRAGQGALEPPGKEVCAQRLGYNACVQHSADSVIRTMLYDPPFTQQFDQAERAKRWDARLEALKASMEPDKLKAALADCEKALDAAPHDWTLRANYANLVAQSGAAGLAIEQYYSVVERVPHHYPALVKMAGLRLSGGDAAGARLCLEAALPLDPDSPSIHYELAKAIAAQGDHDKALAEFERGMHKHPRRAEGLALLGNFLFSLGKTAEARERLDEALRIDPNDATAHIILGHLHVSRGEEREAIEHYEAAVRAKPSAAPVVATGLAKLKAHAGK